VSHGTFREVNVAEGVALARHGYRIVDVREVSEWDEGHVAGATLIPLGDVATRLVEAVPDRATPLLLYCRSGARSARASAYLASIGYTDVVNLNGFIAAWREAGGEWVDPPAELSAADRQRYARQLALPEIGPEGQRRLLESRVAVVGLGGLGSPAATYLAAAGVGTLSIVDDDVVDESNLHRQVIHSAARIGWSKVDSAAESLRGVNATTTVVPHRERLNVETADRLIASCDVVVDATDTYEARYAINDAAVRARIPVVHGSVYRWQGQVTTLVPFAGPCYRCLHPAAPPPELVPDCDVAGVIGVVPGVIGMLQATEALKLLLGVGEPLVGRLLTFDALAGTFDVVRTARDAACAACAACVPAPA
jgi:sulfur-carrier protein adenylyltransferase/sulfurtransferase